MDGVSEQILANLAKKEKENTLPNEISEFLISLVSNAKSTDSRTLITKPLQDVCCVEGEIACLSCEIIKDETAVTWYKDDVEILPPTYIILKMHGKIHELSIPRTAIKDGGRYSIKVKQSTSEAKLTVKALISSHFVDTTCLEGSTIVLSCEVSVEDIGGIWYKDDSVVVESSQIYPTVNSRIHQLNIFQSEIKDGGKYVFKIRDKISSAILTVKCTTKRTASPASLDDNASPFEQARATQDNHMKEDSNMLYRLLRREECCGGILRAKKPNSTKSIFDHVIGGSHGTPSKYISTCGSWRAVNAFQSKSYDPGLIVKIQKDKLPSGVAIIDLRRQENRYQYIDNDVDNDSISKFNNFAQFFEEVLLIGDVPAWCFEVMDNQEHARQAAGNDVGLL